MVESFNAVVDIGSSSGICGARLSHSPEGWRCEAIGHQAWIWGDGMPCPTAVGAVRRFADRWLGAGQGLFCSILTIARCEASPAISPRPLAFSAPARSTAASPRVSPSGETIVASQSRKVGGPSAGGSGRWLADSR